MTNFDLYKLLNFVVSKDVYSQSMSPAEFDLELKAKNLRHFRKRLGLPENYTPGMVGVSATRMNEIDLKPFFVEGTYSVSPITGEVVLLNWYYIEDFYSTTSRTGDIISHQEVGQRLNNALTNPTTKDLVAYIIKNGLRVFPYGTGGVSSVKVMYYRKPNEPSFIVTINPVTLDYTYSFTSVELEWDDGSKLDILHMIIADHGYATDRQDLSQYAMKLIDTGK